MDKKYSKYCLVPQCQSTSIKTPEKIFISLPVGSTAKAKKRRKLWLHAMRKNESDISENSRGYVCDDHFNLEEDMRNYLRYKLMGGKIFLKDNVVPHIFECQTNRKRRLPLKRAVTNNRAKKALHKSAEEEHSEYDLQAIEGFRVLGYVVPEELVLSKSNDANVRTQTVPIDKDTASSRCIPNVVQTKTVCKDYEVISMTYSPPKLESSSKSPHINDDDDTDSESFVDLKSDENINYLGIPKDSNFVVDLLEKHTKIPARDIYVTLKKIKTNLSFELIGSDFGLAYGEVAKIFKRTVPSISACLKTLIFWPSKDSIKQNLPIPFRTKYSNVQSIINSFEIKIEKPSNVIKQATTWSEYKKTNTIKYVTSSTPDGLINFVSNGFGGRTSDVTVVKKSDFLTVLPRSCSVMTNRGFKRIDVLLQRLNCKLIRPPRVKAGVKNTKEEVMEYKKLAAIHAHIEQVIERLEEFEIFKSPAGINTKLIKYLDHLVNISCALINLQSSIIKK